MSGVGPETPESQCLLVPQACVASGENCVSSGSTCPGGARVQGGHVSRRETVSRRREQRVQAGARVQGRRKRRKRLRTSSALLCKLDSRTASVGLRSSSWTQSSMMSDSVFRLGQVCMPSAPCGRLVSIFSCGHMGSVLCWGLPSCPWEASLAPLGWVDAQASGSWAHSCPLGP